MVVTALGSLLLVAASVTILPTQITIVQTPYSKPNEVAEVTKNLLPDDKPLAGKELIRCKAAQELVRDWGKRLRLNLWTIGVVCGVPEEHRNVADQGLEFHGQTQMSSEDYVAVIWFNMDSSMPTEATVIHELLHVLLTDYRIGYSKDTDERVVRVLGKNLYASRDGSDAEKEQPKP